MPQSTSYFDYRPAEHMPGMSSSNGEVVPFQTCDATTCFFFFLYFFCFARSWPQVGVENEVMDDDLEVWGSGKPTQLPRG